MYINYIAQRHCPIRREDTDNNEEIENDNDATMALPTDGCVVNRDSCIYIYTQNKSMSSRQFNSLADRAVAHISA